MERKKQHLTPSQALVKAASYCAYQERCHAEVEQKLSEWGIYGLEAGNIMQQLIAQNYLNEERFARAFAGGKFRVKKWGRVKISLELRARDVSDYCIQSAMKEIGEEEYRNALKDEAAAKLHSLRHLPLQARLNRAAAYLMGKGYEGNLVWEVVAGREE